MAGIQPPVLVTDIDPKLAVHRSNNQNRDATPGQQAMAVALAFPETQQGKKRTSLKIKEVGLNAGYISQARFVLRNNPKLAVHRSNNQNRDATPGQKAMAVAMAFPEAKRGGDRKSSSFAELDRSGFAKASLSYARFVLRNNPKLAVHRSNNQNRDATPGQKAMATAMAWPDATDKGGRGKKGKTVDSINGFDRAYLSRARFILRNNPPAADSPFPQYALDVMAGRMTLTEA